MERHERFSLSKVENMQYNIKLLSINLFIIYFTQFDYKNNDIG
jgi:hypothetical protein